jgi:hypothetical protein
MTGFEVTEEINSTMWDKGDNRRIKVDEIASGHKSYNSDEHSVCSNKSICGKLGQIHRRNITQTVDTSV